MALNAIPGRDAVTCAAIGVVGALIFLFAFPKGSISTLMHEVLGLPGPGAGIVLILGPFMVIVAIVAYLTSQGAGGAMLASLAFAVAYAGIVRLLDIPTNPKGAFGSAVFLAAVLLCGLAVEAVMMPGRAANTAWRCALAGASANGVLFVFYWLAIFPRTAGWIQGKDIPLLAGLCVVCGLVSGCIAWGVSKPFSRALALKEKE